jgi:hypothetical protein
MNASPQFESTMDNVHCIIQISHSPSKDIRVLKIQEDITKILIIIMLSKESALLLLCDLLSL